MLSLWVLSIVEYEPLDPAVTMDGRSAVASFGGSIGSFVWPNNGNEQYTQNFSRKTSRKISFYKHRCEYNNI
jgi:hypothetical protein